MPLPSDLFEPETANVAWTFSLGSWNPPNMWRLSCTKTGISARFRTGILISAVLLASLAPAQTRIWVATNGNNAWNGYQPNHTSGSNGPKATLAGARDLIRTLKEGGALSPLGAIVTVRPGRYKLYGSFQLNSRDSGVSGARIVWRSELVGKAILDGGKEVTKWLDSAHRPVVTQVKPEFRGKIQVASLDQNQIYETGNMRHNAPNNTILPEWGEFYFGEHRMTLAQWPNTEGAYMSGLGNGNSNSAPCVRTDMTKLNTPSYTRQQISGETATDYWLRGTINYRQYMQYQERVVKLDRTMGDVQISVEDGNTDDTARHAYYDQTSIGRFTLVNSLWEIDSPGEYYIDRGANLLYFYPTGKLALNRASISMTKGPIVSITGTSYLDIQGFLVEGGRQNGINVLRGTSVVIRGNHVRNCGGTGVWVYDGNAVTVRSCEIENVGETGVHLEGGIRSSLRRGNHLAENNYIHNVGVVQPYYRPCIRLKGFGLTARGNELAYHRHQAIHFFGNDLVMENNNIHDVVLDALDAAAIYCGDGDWTTRGNVIRFNYFHDIRKNRPGYHGVHGVYLDDMNSSTNVYSNVFRNVQQPIQIGGGHDNYADHNVFVDSYGGVRVDDRGLTAAWDWINRFFILAGDVPWQSNAWKAKYPGAYATLTSQNYRWPTGNSIVGNVSLRGSTCEWIWGIYELWGVNAGASPDILVFQDNVATTTQQFVDEPNGDFTPKPGSAAEGAGLTPILLSNIGVKKDTFIDPTDW